MVTVSDMVCLLSSMDIENSALVRRRASLQIETRVGSLTPAGYSQSAACASRSR